MLLGSLLWQKLLKGGRHFSLEAAGEELSRGGRKETLESSAAQRQEDCSIYRISSRICILRH